MPEQRVKNQPVKTAIASPQDKAGTPLSPRVASTRDVVRCQVALAGTPSLVNMAPSLVDRSRIKPVLDVTPNCGHGPPNCG